ncbi:MAG: alanine racemase [Clostridiales bacterium]|nr:alanine racemase [Clostridiales bacterium]
MAARLLIDLAKLRHNAHALAELCHRHNVRMAAVTKVFCADARMVETLRDTDTPVDSLADSRLTNLASYPQTRLPRMLMRLPAPGDVLKALQYCDIALHSELATLAEFEEVAGLIRAKHDVLLMIDMGDLREGIHYSNMEQLQRCTAFVKGCKNLRLAGFGVNLTCYGGILPTKDNLGRFCEIATGLAAQYDIENPIISGGNSSSLYLLERGELPVAVNHLRIGEALVRGIETAYLQALPFLEQDVVTLDAEIIELQEKPSMPEGIPGKNAFGEDPDPVEDRGRRLRALLAVGRQDTDPGGLTCLTPGVEVLGASSDHLICDVTDAQKLPPIGGRLQFSLSYGAILRGFTTSLVERVYFD